MVRINQVALSPVRVYVGGFVFGLLWAGVAAVHGQLVPDADGVGRQAAFGHLIATISSHWLNYQLHKYDIL